MEMPLYSTQHSVFRQAQRNLSDDDVQFVLDHGRRFYRGGALHVFLGRRDIPAEKSVVRRFGHLEGTVLVLKAGDSPATLITAYRNRRALKQIRAKARYDRRTGVAVYA